jgi:hypothetical protein
MKRGEVIVLLWLLLGELIFAASIERIYYRGQLEWALVYTIEKVAEHVVRLVKKGEWNPHVLLVRALLKTVGPVSDDY